MDPRDVDDDEWRCGSKKRMRPETEEEEEGSAFASAAKLLDGLENFQRTEPTTTCYSASNKKENKYRNERIGACENELYDGDAKTGRGVSRSRTPPSVEPQR